MEKRVKHIELKPEMRVDELVEEMGKSGVFSAGRVAKAVEIYHEMLKAGSTIFMGVGGAMVPGGLRRVLTQAINEELVNVIVTTGANVTHDLIEAFGGYHARGEALVDDAGLRERGISRIFDVYVPQQIFELFEDHIQPMFAEVTKNGARISSAELLRRIGSHLKDENSFVKAAATKNVPVFCPAIADSILGLQAWLYSQEHELNIDCLRDVQEMVELASNAKEPGAVLLGGGVPKNFIFQSMLLTPKSFKYAIQVTMDRPEPGGLSGATLEEAKSWGKVTPDAKLVTVIGDVTVIFPIIVAAVLKK
ncbi:MAG: deoxyhypusine synthase [Hadesarchaea archaeon]|nr:deoxyhypusine synthase [Hadesarchaea archaeon]MDH5685856.1 deoxyhypusine synthase [Hadesarchaea archaeon]